MTFDDMLRILQNGGLLAGAVVILIGGYRKWWVWGHQLDEMRTDRDEWKNLFLRTIRVTETAVTVAKQKGA
jgi:hypothetical protein